MIDNGERKFLHDLSNPLSIVYGNIKILSSKLERPEHSVSEEDLMKRLTKMIHHFERANSLIDARRKVLRD